MGWSYRKTLRSGPFRMNFSGKGVSYSLGFKGARISSGPGGTFVSLSSHGIRYRQQISSPRAGGPGPVSSGTAMPRQSGTVQQIGSLAIGQLTDSESRDFILEMARKASMISYRNRLGIAPLMILLAMIGLFSFSGSDVAVNPAAPATYVRVKADDKVNIRRSADPHSAVVHLAADGDSLGLLGSSGPYWLRVSVQGHAGYINRRFAKVVSEPGGPLSQARPEPAAPEAFYEMAGCLLLFLPLIIFLHQWDRRRMQLELHYDLDPHFEHLCRELNSHFARFAASARIWQYLTRQQGVEARRHGGAGQLIQRVPVLGVFGSRMPLPNFSANVPVPCIRLKHLELYFLPERLLIKRGGTFAAIFYKHLQVSSHTTRFVEDELLPADARVMEHTWQFVNKQGGPDRRFRNNRQLPVCAYSQYSFTSGTGFHEVITTSRPGAMDAFTALLSQIGALQSRMPVH